MIAGRIAGVLTLCAGSAILAQPVGMEPSVHAALVARLRFSEREVADVYRGRVVQHALPPRAPGEIAVVGAVRIHAPKAAFFARVRDIARFKSGPDVLQIGAFGNPPSIGDLAALTVTADDFDARSCRVGDCGVRLSESVIEHISHEIDSRAPDAPARASALFKELLVGAAAAYMAGTHRMTQYDDGPRPIRPQEEFEAVLSGMPEMTDLMPSLFEHLRNFPWSRLPGAEDFLYWSKEKFGIAPFISVTHVTIVCPSASICLMTTRDVYSSRYLDASIALAIASDAGPDAFDLVYDNRSRANALKGAFATLRRMMTERRARTGVEESLKTLKLQLEQD